MAASGNLLVDELRNLNENITLLNSKIDSLLIVNEKIEQNTKPATVEPV